MTSAESDCGRGVLPVGPPLPDWNGSDFPRFEEIEGRRCRVERLRPGIHARDLFDAFSEDTEGRNWTYLPYGPFGTRRALEIWMEGYCTGRDPLFFAVIDKGTGKALGWASYLNIRPDSGVIEVGHINYAPALQNSIAASEAMFLMMRAALTDCGYRRYEWKCDALNARSRRAASRLGFSFEGIFRNATIYKRRNRDTAWYSIIDSEWPKIQAAFESWLDPANFDSGGRQIRRLQEFIKNARSD